MERRATTEVSLENLRDLWEIAASRFEPYQARKRIVTAIVDPEACFLCLPASLIEQLGLEKTGTRRARGLAGQGPADLFGPLRLTIQGRATVMDAMEVPDNVPTLIGHIVLTALDLVVDPQHQCLTGNPAHNGDWVYELYYRL